MIGKIWIFYEWAAQVLMALANYVGAWPGVVVLSVLSAATSVAILAWHLLRHVGGVVAASASLAAVLGLYHHLLARPHVLAWPVSSALELWSHSSR